MKVKVKTGVGQGTMDLAFNQLENIEIDRRMAKTFIVDRNFYIETKKAESKKLSTDTISRPHVTKPKHLHE